MRSLELGIGGDLRLRLQFSIGEKTSFPVERSRIRIYFNVYGRNNYAISLGRRIWKYAFLGILAGFIAGWAIRLALVLSAMEGTKEISSSTALVAIHWVLMYVSGLIGVWIGNRKVLKETTDYIR
jgi:hypothetical protein